MLEVDQRTWQMCGSALLNTCTSFIPTKLVRLTTLSFEELSWAKCGTCTNRYQPGRQSRKETGAVRPQSPFINQGEEYMYASQPECSQFPTPTYQTISIAFCVLLHCIYCTLPVSSWQSELGILLCTSKPLPCTQRHLVSARSLPELFHLPLTTYL